MATTSGGLWYPDPNTYIGSINTILANVQQSVQDTIKPDTVMSFTSTAARDTARTNFGISVCRLTLGTAATVLQQHNGTDWITVANAPDVAPTEPADLTGLTGFSSVTYAKAFKSNGIGHLNIIGIRSAALTGSLVQIATLPSTITPKAQTYATGWSGGQTSHALDIRTDRTVWAITTTSTGGTAIRCHAAFAVV